MLIIDSAVHLWAGAPPPPHHRPGVFRAEQALAAMAVAGVDAALNIPPVWDPGSNAYGVRAALAHPDRFATFGWIDFTEPRAAAALEAWPTTPGMHGLRIIGASPAALSWPDDGSLDWVWSTAERLGVRVSVAGPAILPDIARVAERHPGLRIIIDHLGMIARTPGGGLVQAPDILALARFPNVGVKLSGIPDYAADPYPYRSFHGHVRRLRDAYGSARLFWGTDLTRLPCSWREAVTMFTEEMSWMPTRDLELIMGEALSAWTGWRPRDPSTPAPHGRAP